MLGGLAVAVLLQTGGCPTSPDGSMDNPGDPISNVSLARDVQPILAARCTGCHSDGGFADRAGIPMLLSEGDSHAAVTGVASDVDDTLTLVVPGDPDASYFLEKIVSDAPARGARMPLFSGPLDDREVETIRVWIQEGALDN